jgi:hypothetical protein
VVVSDAVAVDRKANADEVRRHAALIRRIATDLGLGPARIRGDGALVIHSDEPGYHGANRLSAAASAVVGAYVHVITDDVPGAVSAKPL